MRALRPPMEIAAGCPAGRNHPRQGYGNHGLHGMRGRQNISYPYLARRSAAAAMKRLLPLIAAAVLLAPSIGFAQSCSGCSCHGGPGYRLANGKCVSWAQHEKHQSVGDFPAGAACEHPEGCRLETPRGVKSLTRGEMR